jgi:ABC-2 type transport system ATP-binding protein
MLKPERKIIKAVDGVSFSIERGEMVGFIGPNGAGKSTTIKMLTGILVPSSGRVKVLGLSPYADRRSYVAKIGAVFGQRSQLWWDLPLTDTFALLRKIYGIPLAAYKANRERFDDLLGIRDFESQPVRQLSLGQRMRADIAAALLHDPEIVFFDEPTIGLDVVAKDKIRRFIRAMNGERRVTMLFTTHDMQDIEKTCDRAIIIDKGKLLYDGAIEQIKKSLGQERAVVVEFKQAYGEIRFPGTEVEVLNEFKKRFKFRRDEVDISGLLSELTSRYEILDLAIEESDIESIVKRIYEGGALDG